MFVPEYPDFLPGLAQFSLGLIAAGLFFFSGLQVRILSPGRRSPVREGPPDLHPGVSLAFPLFISSLAAVLSSLTTVFATKPSLIFSVLAFALALSALALALCSLTRNTSFLPSREKFFPAFGFGLHALASFVLWIDLAALRSSGGLLTFPAALLSGFSSLWCFIPLNRYCVRSFERFRMNGLASGLSAGFVAVLLGVSGILLGEGIFRSSHPEADVSRETTARLDPGPDVEQSTPGPTATTNRSSVSPPPIPVESAVFAFGCLAVSLLMLGIGMASLRKATRLLDRQNDLRLGRERSKIDSTLQHEAGTALQVILGYSHLLLAEANDERQRTMLSRLAENSSLLHRIIEDFTNGRDRNDRQPHISSNQKLQPYFENIVSDFELTRGSGKGSVHLEFSHKLPATACFDGHLLRQALTNLLQNAAAHGGNSPQIKFLVEDLEMENARHLRIVVSDDGTGIPSEFTPEMFAPFSKGPESNGAGLGLCVVQEAVSRMSGSVSYSKREEGGASFELFIPLNPPREEATAGKSGPTLLIVDDHPSIGELLKDFARKSGWEAIVSETSADAIKRAKSVPFEAAIADLRLHGADGSTLLHDLKRHRPGLFLIAMSAGGEEETRRAAEKVGVRAILTKPFSSGDLERLLRFRGGTQEKTASPKSNALDLMESGQEALSRKDGAAFEKAAHNAVNESFARANRQASRCFASAGDLAKSGNWEAADNQWSRGWEIFLHPPAA